MSRESCIVCIAAKFGLSYEALLAEFGAVRLWREHQVHEEEKHEN